jgi:hypothetical protein
MEKLNRPEYGRIETMGSLHGQKLESVEMTGTESHLLEITDKINEIIDHLNNK